MSLDPAPRRFPVPHGVRSSVTLHELAELQRFASEAGTVLEIGTHFGFSCIGMALAGAHVTSVDPHFEGPADNPDTWEPFLANLRRHGLAYVAFGDDTYTSFGGAPPELSPTINAFRMTIETAYLKDWRWGLVFIDGDHVWPYPWRDIEIAQAHLREGGVIAMHDVTPNWPGVYRAAHQLQAQGWREVGGAGTLRVYRRAK